MTAPASVWGGIAIVLASTGVLVAGVWTWRRRSQPEPELTRKAVHIGMGLVATTLPWLFDRTWPVLALCSGLALAFLVLKLFLRRSEFGVAMHDIGRDSRGDMYFAVSVAVLWLLAGGDRLLYLVPMLVLTLGDAMAALVGRRYGKRHFDDRPGGKTLEGSTTLFVVAFLCAEVPLVLSGRVTLGAGLLMATTLALLVTLLEAMASHGLDNALVPIGAFLVLRDSLALDSTALVWRLAVAVGCVAVALMARSRTTLSAAALAGLAAFGYLLWALGASLVAAPLLAR